MLISLLAATTMMLADDPEGVVSTAPRGHQSVMVGAAAPEAPEVPTATVQNLTPQDLTTDEQIDRWISQRAPAEKPFSRDNGSWAGDRWAEARDDRKMHGEVSASMGTGDFTAYSAAVSIPVGENGRINLSYSQSKNSPWGYGYGYDRYRYGRQLGFPGLAYGDPYFLDRGVVYPGRGPSGLYDRDRDPYPLADPEPAKSRGNGAVN